MNAWAELLKALSGSTLLSLRDDIPSKVFVGCLFDSAEIVSFGSRGLISGAAKDSLKAVFFIWFQNATTGLKFELFPPMRFSFYY